ncbi:MAG: 5'-methylthioadenosine/S-adenosylhomocysteine nucleosidase, partial [Lachnospiraceae bacterium]|nr:5'-methylthioadenosine/S-adenosylhomocysteine nucleosidase [Lachnospiraceae bacterium]
PRMKTSVFVADEALRKLAKDSCIEVNPDINVFEGRVVSGDQFISDKAKKDYIVNNFKGYCTEMEGAAIAQAAYLNGIPFLIIRAISDKADDSATMDYPTFEAKAIEHSVRLVKAMVESY